MMKPSFPNAPEAVFIVNSNSVIRFATPTAAAYYGYPVDDMIGHTALRFVAPDEYDAVRDQWLEFVNDESRQFGELTATMITANRRRTLVRISLWRMPGSDDFLIVNHVIDHIRDRLETLYSILTAMSGTLDLTQVLDILLAETQRLIAADESTIFILRDDGRLQVMHASRPASTRFSQTGLEHLQEYETIRILRDTGQPLIINNCDQDPRWRGDEDCAIKSWMGAPLIHRGEFLGVLNLDSTHCNAFTHEDAELVQALASQTAAALHNARQFENEQHRAERFAALNEVSQAISQLDLNSLLAVIYQKISRLMDATTFFIGLYDIETEIVRLVGSYDHGQPSPDEVQPANTGMIGRVLRTRQSVIVRDSEKEAFPEETILDDDIPRSVLMVPLIAQDDLVGVITVQSYQPNAYTPDDIAMLETIAGSTATAIRNAQLYDQTNERLAVLQGLHQMAIRLAASQDPNLIANLTMHTALDLFRPTEIRLLLCDEPDCPPAMWSGSVTGRYDIPSITQSPLPSDEQLAQLRRIRQPVVIDDMLDYPDMRDEFVTHWPVQAAAAYPLLHGSRQHGLLILLYDTPHFFRADMLRALELLCIQAATALENAQYTITLRRRLDEVSALQDLARRVSSSDTLDEILNTVVRKLRDVYQCKSASIALYDPDLNRVITRAGAGLKPEYIAKAQFELDELGAGQVVATGEVVYVPDTWTATGYRHIDPDIRSMLTVPLLVQDRTIGALTIDSTIPNAFTPDHERLLMIAGGQIAATIEMVRLLEEARERAAQLAQANTELAAMDELRTKLLQDVSHELRNPLALVRGYAGLLRDDQLGPLTPDQAEAIVIIDERAEAITRLVSDLLATEQISRKTLMLDRVDLSRLCRDTVNGAQLIYQDRDVTIRGEVADDALLVEADRSRLNQVLDNLIGNAVKFSPEGGTITVRAQRTGSGAHVRVSVSDQGIGIPADRLPHVFERFFQGDRSVKARFGGSGLGLYIVRQIVEAHGGSVWVESREGAGSTFTFELPLSER